MKRGTEPSNLPDIEPEGNAHPNTTSEALESLWDFIPCMIEQKEINGTDVEVNQTDKEPTSYATQSPLKIGQSESFFDDTKPPPMALAASTSETDDDDEEIINASKEQLLTDPFAPREGRTLCWRNINMTLVRFLFFMLNHFTHSYELIS